MFQQWIKRGATFLAIIICLIAALLVFLHTTAGKSFVRKKVESYLQEKWMTRVLIGGIDYRLPDWIALENVLILDRHQDTLLSGGRLYVGIRLLKLLSNTIDVRGVVLEEITLNCYREAGDSTFNFQFILDAFAPSASEKTVPSQGSQMQLSVNQLILDHVSFSLNDKKEKLYISAIIDRLSCFPEELNLKKTFYHINEVFADNGQITVVDSSSNIKGKSKSVTKNRGDPAAISLSLNNVKFHDIKFSYREPYNKTGFQLLVDSLQLKQASLDFSRQVIYARNIRLSNTNARLDNFIPKDAVQENKMYTSSASPDNWKISVDTITLMNNSFVYDNTALPKTKGLDYQHLDIRGIDLETSKSIYDSSGLSTELVIDALNCNDQLNLKGFSAFIRYTDNLLHVKDLKLTLNQSQISTGGDIMWQIKPGSQHTSLPQFHISNAIINYGDLLLIQPALGSLLPFSFAPSENIILSGKFSGTIQNLAAKEISLTTSSKLFRLKGDLAFDNRGVRRGLIARIQHLELKKQLLSKKLLYQFDKSKINLPEEILLSGKIHADAEMLQADFQLNSTFGQLALQGTATNLRQPAQLDYNLKLDANNFETGKWIGLDPLLGKITGQIFIKGSGLKKDNLQTDARIQLQSAIINGHTFSNIDLEGELGKSKFTFMGQIHDQDLETEMNFSGQISPGTAVQGNIQVKRADLAKLGLTTDSIVLASRINVHVNYSLPRNLEVQILADSNTISINGKDAFADSLSIICRSDEGSTLIMARAPFMNATLWGNYPVSLLSSEISSLLKAIYPVNSQEKEKSISHGIRNRQTSFNLVLAQDELLHSLIPDLQLLQPITLNGRYDAGKIDSFFFMNAHAPYVIYNKYTGDDIQFKAESSDSAILFSFSGRDIMSGTNHLVHPDITGRLQQDLLLVKGRVEDTTGREYYSGSVAVKLGKNETLIRLLDDLTLNYNRWKVSSDNSVLVLKDGIVVNNLSLEHRGQLLYINSKDQQTISPIEIRIDSFDVGNMLSIASYNDTLLAKGTVKAEISILQPLNKVPFITGFIQAKQLEVFNIPVGDFSFYSTASGDSLNIKGGISGNNMLNFSGSLHPANGNVDIQTHLQKLDISLFRGFVKEWLTNVSGMVTGELRLSGSLDTMQCQGFIGLDSTTFAIKDLNALYRINGQKIFIEYPEINFRQFTLLDKENDQLTIQGKVTVKPNKEIGLNLDFETKNLTVLDAIRKQGSPIYGTGILDAKVSIKGTCNEPVLDGSAYLRDKSSVHFILLPQRTSTKTRKGGIIFVDIDTLFETSAADGGLLKDSAIARNTIKGLKYNLDLKVNKDAEFSVIIDPSTNDELVIKGDGSLNAGLAESGDMGITGVYHLQSGYYKMNNLLLKGKFMLVKGSTITFDGDPMSAVADVSTEYIVETSPKGLMPYSESDDEAYSQKLPFVVIFMIKGPISKPVLSFDIRLKQGKTSITSSMKTEIEHELERLRSDMSVMNQQVFSLLLTKRFTVADGTNSLESSNLNANNALKEGVSSFLTEAMNQVADQLIKGVDIDVNMKTYKAGDDPISKTDLGVAMSKELLQSRMVITVEENFAVGDDGSTSAQKSGSQYIPDITSTYKLSKDGHFQVKAYQKNEYDAVVQGYFTEVGVSFTFELTYDNLKELFNRKKYASNEEK